MKSSKPGINTSEAEVTQIDSHGIWILVKDKEYFLPYDDFPWFKKARVSDVFQVELHHGVHLHWPSLDVDLTLKSLDHPEKYPRVAEH